MPQQGAIVLANCGQAANKLRIGCGRTEAIGDSRWRGMPWHLASLCPQHHYIPASACRHDARLRYSASTVFCVDDGQGKAQVALRDAVGCGLLHYGLGAERDADAGSENHRDIVCAVADGDGAVHRHAI